MSKIRGKNTKPEIIVRRCLHSLGFRFRLHSKRLPGCPDIVLPKYKSVIFVHGCFWHRHPFCKNAATPKSNVEFWSNKLNGNVSRFDVVKKELSSLGWVVIVVWECETKNLSKLKELLITTLSVDVRRAVNEEPAKRTGENNARNSKDS